MSIFILGFGAWHKYWIDLRRNRQIIKNSQTKCMKDEWFRSSLVFDIISLKQISPLTQSLWCFETHGRLPPRIKWSTTRKRSTQGRALRTTQCLFLSLWHKMNAQNILTMRVFLKKKKNSWMRDHEIIHNFKLKHCFKDNSCIQTYWLKK